jgi:hypothetical protein
MSLGHNSGNPRTNRRRATRLTMHGRPAVLFALALFYTAGFAVQPVFISRYNPAARNVQIRHFPPWLGPMNAAGFYALFDQLTLNFPSPLAAGTRQSHNSIASIRACRRAMFFDPTETRSPAGFLCALSFLVFLPTTLIARCMPGQSNLGAKYSGLLYALSRKRCR